MDQTAHERLHDELADKLMEIDGVTDLETVSADETTSVFGFTLHGVAYSLTFNVTP